MSCSTLVPSHVSGTRKRKRPSAGGDPSFRLADRGTDSKLAHLSPDPSPLRLVPQWNPPKPSPIHLRRRLRLTSHRRETIARILSFADYNRRPSHITRTEGWTSRSASLTAAALVSKEWSDQAYRQLYGDLRIRWGGARRQALLAKFKNNPVLHSIVRKVACDAWSLELWDKADDERSFDAALALWPEGNEEAFNAHREAGRVAAIVSYGEPGWLSGPPEVTERESEDSFWAWLAQHEVSGGAEDDGTDE